MILVQTSFAGVNIFYKLAAIDGMNLRVLVAYRILFAAAFIVPLAFFLERGSLVQNLYLESLVLTSATFTAAMANLIPAVTFILAVCFRLEKVSLKSVSGKAKILGTLLGIGGAMILTFYKGIEVKLWSTNSHFLKQTTMGLVIHDGQNRLVGSFLALGSCFSYAAWLIVQAKMSESYGSPYSSTALMSIMGSVQAVVFALCVDRDLSLWKLGWNIRLLTVAYSGIVASGVSVTVIAWCVRVRGPLFVSIFNPLTLILVALAGSLILDEKLYIGSVIGAILIVFGLYAVIWGKGKEIKKMTKLVPSMSLEDSVTHNASTNTDDATKKDDDQSSHNDITAARVQSIDEVVVERNPL
ncbi:hypothetical protein BVRB_7g162980 [Beta vulgaris subsp. vulgaris]|nr:hypothetical protein BVRB_7g162980 [Beta vulgaris subsp. vulgaris]